jgi:hypothetical protein
VWQTDDTGPRHDEDVRFHDAHPGLLPVSSMWQAYLLRLQRQPRTLRMQCTAVVRANLSGAVMPPDLRRLFPYA